MTFSLLRSHRLGDPKPAGNTPEERALAAARNVAEARAARIEQTLDEGFGPDAKLAGSREYEARRRRASPPPSTPWRQC